MAFIKSDCRQRNLNLIEAVRKQIKKIELTGDRFPLPVNTGHVDGRAVSRVDGVNTARVDG